jgi:AcrR family transcriptional regulator
MPKRPAPRSKAANPPGTTTPDGIGLPDGPDMPERVLHILTEAAALFAEHGYERTSMRDLADRCGVSKSLLYHHFADKEDIYTRIALGFMRELHEFVAARIPAAGTARDRVGAFMAGSAAFFERYRLVWLASTDAFWSDPKLRQSGERLEWRRAYENLLRGLLLAGVRTGELTELDVPMAGRLILSALNWLPRWYQPGGKLDAVGIVAGYHRLVFDGLAARDPASVPRATPARGRRPIKAPVTR